MEKPYSEEDVTDSMEETRTTTKKTDNDSHMESDDTDSDDEEVIGKNITYKKKLHKKKIISSDLSSSDDIKKNKKKRKKSSNQLKKAVKKQKKSNKEEEYEFFNEKGIFFLSYKILIDLDGIEDNIITYERWDIKALVHIKELFLDPITEKKLNMIKLEPNVSRIRVMNSTINGDHKDRLFAYIIPYKKDDKNISSTSGGISLQGLDKWIRRFIAHKYYLEYDIKNCGPALLSQILAKHGLCPTELKDYVDGGRNKIYEKYEEQKYKREDIKRVFLNCFNIGQCDKRFIEAVKLRSVLKDALKKLIQMDIYRELYEYSASTVQSKKEYDTLETIEEKEEKILGSFCANLWIREEKKISLAMRDFFVTKGYDKSLMVFIFNALLVEQTQQMKINLKELERFIFEKTKFDVLIEENDLKPTEEDWIKYNGEKSDMKILTSLTSTNHYKQRYDTIILEAQRYGYKRYGELVMEKHPSIPGVYRPIEVKGEVLTASAWIDQVLCNKDSDHHALCDMRKMIKWYINNDHEQFKIIKFERHICSFIDCYMDINEEKFVFWDDCNKDDIPTTNWYFEQKIGHDNHLKNIEETSLWAKLLSTQLVKEGDYNKEGKYDKIICLEILIGRLFFPLKSKYSENWKVAPNITGPCDTGKTALNNIINAMRPKGTVKYLNSTFEEIFGLQSLCHGETSHIEVTGGKWLSSKIHQTTLKSMISGGGVSAPTKNGNAVIKPWRIPFIFRCNDDDFGYKYGEYQITKRIHNFYFDTPVTGSIDPHLEENIIKNELVYVMIRCILRYCEAAKSGKTFWSDIAPKSMTIIGKSTTTNKEDDLTMMLENGLDDGIQNIQFIKELNDDKSVNYKEMVTLASFNNYFKTYTKIRYNDKKTNKEIYSTNNTLKTYGYIFKLMNYCKGCGKVSTTGEKMENDKKIKCCDKKSGHNRGKWYYIQGMSYSIKDSKS